MLEFPVTSISPTERNESNTNRNDPESEHVSQSTGSKDSSELQMVCFFCRYLKYIVL